MYRLMKAFGISRINNIDELKAICSAAVDFYYPSTFVYNFEHLSDKCLLGVIKSCGTYETVKKREY